MESWGQHLRFAARQLGRNPGFTVTVIITLALSVGANTAIFSLVNALMLKSLPYARPERMGTIYARVTGRNPSDQRRALDGERWELLRDNVPALISAVSGGTSGVNLQAGSRVQYVHDGRVSAHYFDVLALQPILGRNFSTDEDRPHGPKAAILSDSLWRNVFGADPSVLVRMKEDYDGAEPTASSVSVMNLLLLAHLVEDRGWTEQIERTLRLFAGRLEQLGRAVPMMAAALSTYLAGLQQIIIAGKEGRADLERAIGAAYRPFAFTVALDDNQEALARIAPWVGAMRPIDGKATAFVCRNFACDRPVTSGAALAERLETGSQARGQA